jgi:hypothetical protein
MFAVFTLIADQKSTGVISAGPGTPWSEGSSCFWMASTNSLIFDMLNDDALLHMAGSLRSLDMHILTNSLEPLHVLHPGLLMPPIEYGMADGFRAK